MTCTHSSKEHKWLTASMKKDKKGDFVLIEDGGLGFAIDTLKCQWCDTTVGYETVYPQGKGDVALEVARTWRSTFSHSWKKKQDKLDK